jgi:hypothetical protein
MNFHQKLRAAQGRNHSRLCIGLNILARESPLPITLYDEPLLPFARAIIEDTSDIACAYAVATWPYLFEGAAGIVALERIVRLVPDDVPLIFDGRFPNGDTLPYHLSAAFDKFNADAVTLGFDADEAIASAIQPFPNRAVLLPLGKHDLTPRPRVGHWVSSAGCEMLYFERGGDDSDLIVFDLDDPTTGPGTSPKPAIGDLNSVWVISRPILYASKGLDFAEAARNAALSQRGRLGPPGD